STSAKRWSWPMPACWRLRPLKAPTACSRASRNFVKADALPWPRDGACWSRRQSAGRIGGARWPPLRPRRADARGGGDAAGIAVVAGSTIVAEPERIGATADRERLFVLGVRDQAAER